MLSTRILLLILIMSVTNVFSEKSYTVYEILPRTNEQLQVLYNIHKNLRGVTFWKDPTGVNNTVDLMIPQKQYKIFVSLMDDNDLAYDVKISNVQNLLNNATIGTGRLQRTRSRFGYRNFGLLRNFSWTDFHTLDEIYRWLDKLAQRYPNKAKTIIGGSSFEGREIKGIHLSFGQNKKGVFIEAGIHAREWISHTTATYLINELLTSTDPAIRELAESFDWYIFPCVNPDGYVYTHINPRDPEYRLWRKTRSMSAGQQCWGPVFCFPIICYGADPNRNWGYQWGGPGSGRDACDEIYAGRGAFSEIEMRTLSEYIKSLSNNLYAYISFHSYIEKIMFPYGHTPAHLDNYDEEYQVGSEAAKALARRHGMRYEVGNINEVLGGPASGGSVDWVKANLRLPFVYCYELRGHSNNGIPYGFTPPPSEIIPNGQEVVDSLVALFQAAKRKKNVDFS